MQWRVYHGTSFSISIRRVWKEKKKITPYGKPVGFFFFFEWTDSTLVEWFGFSLFWIEIWRNEFVYFSGVVQDLHVSQCPKLVWPASALVKCLFCYFLGKKAIKRAPETLSIIWPPVEGLILELAVVGYIKLANDVVLASSAFHSTHLFLFVSVNWWS